MWGIGAAEVHVYVETGNRELGYEAKVDQRVWRICRGH